MIVDVSNTNPISSSQLKASRAEALVCKCTEGAGPLLINGRHYDRDPHYTVARELAAKQGIPFGGYLFLHPGSRGGEAQWFLDQAGVRDGDLQPWIDAEVRDGASFATVAARVNSCARVLEQQGLRPLLYSYTSFLLALLAAEPKLTRLRIVQASYTARRPKLGHGASVAGWQYTDALPLGRGRFDASRLYVPLDSLRVGASL